MMRHLIVGSAIALALMLSACSSTGPTTTPPASSGPNQNGATNQQGSTGGSTEVLGEAALGGQTYEFTEVILCERFEDGTVQFDLEVIALGKDDTGAFVQLDVTQEAELTGFDWSGPEGLLSSDSTAALTVSGNRITGTGTMLDIEDESTTLELSFDLPLPADATECR